MRILMLSRDREGCDPKSTTFLRWSEITQPDCKIEVCVLHPQDGEFQAENLSVMGTGGANIFVRLWRMYRLGCRLVCSADLIVAQDPFELGLIGYFLARRFGKMLELQDHGGFFDGERSVEPLWWLRARLAKWLARRADSIRTVSPGSFERLQADPLTRTQTYWLPMAAHERFFHMERKVEPGLIISIGRLVPVKRFGVLIRAFAVLHERKPETKLAILGEGPELAHLESLCRELGVEKAVELVGQVDPMPWLAKAQISALTSQHEGWPRAVAEAAHVGVPIVMRDTGSARFFEKRGLAVIPTGDSPSDWADALQQGMQLETRKLDMSENEVLSPDKNLIAYRENWQRVVDRKPRILVCVQAVDHADPWMGYFVDWLKQASTEFSYIHCLALRVGHEELPENVVVIPLRTNSGALGRIQVIFRLWWYAWRLRRCYDGVFVRGDAQYVVFGAWLWRLLDKKIVFWYAHFKANAWLPWAARFADQVVTSVPEACQVPALAIGQAVDEARFELQPFEQREKIQVLMFGRLSASKNVKEVIASFGEAKVSDGVELTLVGTPSNEAYGGEVGSLLEPKPDIYWDNRDVAYADVPELFNSFHVIINATPASLDKVIIEAMMSGRVVIAATGGYRRMLPDDLLWLHADSDKARIKAFQKIKELDLSELELIGQRLRVLAIETHSVHAQVKRLANIFSSYECC